MGRNEITDAQFLTEFDSITATTNNNVSLYKHYKFEVLENLIKKNPEPMSLIFNTSSPVWFRKEFKKLEEINIKQFNVGLENSFGFEKKQLSDDCTKVICFTLRIDSEYINKNKITSNIKGILFNKQGANFFITFDTRYVDKEKNIAIFVFLKLKEMSMLDIIKTPLKQNIFELDIDIQTIARFLINYFHFVGYAISFDFSNSITEYLNPNDFFTNNGEYYYSKDGITNDSRNQKTREDIVKKRQKSLVCISQKYDKKGYCFRLNMSGKYMTYDSLDKRTYYFMKLLQFPIKAIPFTKEDSLIRSIKNACNSKNIFKDLNRVICQNPKYHYLSYLISKTFYVKK